MKKEDFLKVIKFYGLKHQTKKFGEEAFELEEALTEYRMNFNNDNNQQFVEHIVEEMADVLFLFMQFKTFLNISSDEIKEQLLLKIERQKNRMEVEKNEHKSAK